MLAGVKPFSIDDYEKRLYMGRKKPKPLREYNKAVPRELEDVIFTALEYDPYQRPRDAREFRDLLIEVYTQYFLE